MEKAKKKKKNFKDSKFKIRDVVNVRIQNVVIDKLSVFQSEVLGWILKHN